MKYIITESQLKKLIFETYEDVGGQEVFPRKKIAYHVTPDIYVNQILQNGLVPKSESKISSHPERIYLFLVHNMAKNMANILWDATAKETKEKIKDYYVLQIDLTQLPNHKFYSDPETSISYIAIYTLQPIPSSAITLDKKFPTSEFKPGPTPEEIRREKEENEKWLTQYQNTKPEPEDPRWAELDRLSKQHGVKDLYVSMDDLENEY